MLFIKSKESKDLLEAKNNLGESSKKDKVIFSCDLRDKSNLISSIPQCNQVLIRTRMLKSKNKNKITRVLFKLSKLSKTRVKII